MHTGQYFEKPARVRSYLLMVFLGMFLLVALSFAGTGGRYRVFSLKHVSTETAIEFLDEVGIGTVSQLPDANTLLVTASQEKLIKATTIIEVIDSPQQYVFEQILSEPVHIDTDKLRESLPGASVGTFHNPPVRSADLRIIVDVYGQSVVAIAPQELISTIAQEAEQMYQRPEDEKEEPDVETQEPADAEPADTEEDTPYPDLSDISDTAEVVLEPDPEMDFIDDSEKDDPDVSEIDEAVEELFEPELEIDEITDDAEPAEDEPDDLFDSLLGKLAEAESEAAARREVDEPEEEPQVEDEPAVAEEDEPEPRKSEDEVMELITQLQAEQDKELERREAEEQEILQRLEAAEQEEPDELIEPAKPEEPYEPNDLESEVLFEIDREELEEMEPMSYQPELEPDVDEELRLRLPQEVEIIDLISLVGEYYDIDYMYDPGEISGSINLNLRGPVRVQELYALLESALKFRNYAMSRQGRFVIIVPKGKALDIDPAIIREGQQMQLGDITVTRVFELRHIGAEEAESFLERMQATENMNTSISGTGTLMITGYAFRMPRIEQLLDIIDVPGKPRQYRQRQLRYTLAENLTPRIERLAGELDSISVEAEIAAPTDPRQRALERRRAEREDSSRDNRQSAAADTVFLEADERTNRVLMIGTADKLKIVDEIIDSLDVRKQDLRNIRVYEIMNVTAEDVQDKLTQLGIVSTTRGAAGATQRQQEAQRARRESNGNDGDTGAIAFTEEGIAEEPQVVVLENTNSLLVNATTEQHNEIIRIIGYVDTETQREQVPYRLYPLENQDPIIVAETLNQLVQEVLRDLEDKIEVIPGREETIAVIPDESTFSVIVYASRRNQEWIGELIEQLDRRRPQVLIDVTLVEVRRSEEFEYDLEIVANLERAVGDNVITGTDSLPITDITGRHVEGSAQRGRIRGFYAENKIQMLLRAMESKGYGRVLAQPQILVNDNEEGRISTVDRRHVRESEIRIPDTGPPVESFQFQAYDATIELSIRPTISEGDLLRLEIELRREDFVGTGAEGAPPDQLTSNVNTIVTVPDQKTIILGGLVRLTQDKSGRKVPILGDIPLVGGLFRSIDNVDDESKLYVFVQAHILRPDERVAGLPQLEEASDRMRESFEDFERRFQEYEQWPGIKPRPMHPERVLDHD